MNPNPGRPFRYENIAELREARRQAAQPPPPPPLTPSPIRPLFPKASNDKTILENFKKYTDLLNAKVDAWESKFQGNELSLSKQLEDCKMENQNYLTLGTNVLEELELCNKKFAALSNSKDQEHKLEMDARKEEFAALSNSKDQEHKLELEALRLEKEELKSKLEKMQVQGSEFESDEGDSPSLIIFSSQEIDAMDEQLNKEIAEFNACVNRIKDYLDEVCGTLEYWEDEEDRNTN